MLQEYMMKCPLGLHHHYDIITNIELKETHKFIIMDFEFSMVKRTSMIRKLEGRPLLLPINEKARPMVEELQVAVREIKRIFVCKTDLRDACLDQLRQSLTSTRNNLTRDKEVLIIPEKKEIENNTSIIPPRSNCVLQIRADEQIEHEFITIEKYDINEDVITANSISPVKGDKIISHSKYIGATIYYRSINHEHRQAIKEKKHFEYN
ncbi:Uncharacterized protein FWK35_00020494, partial [Aphis craccivora]